MNAPMMINMGSLLSISVQLAGAACQIVKSFHLNKQTKTYMKGVEDYVTEADFKIQSMLIRGLKNYFPHLRIIGEEEKQYEGIIETNYSNFPLLPCLKMNRECISEQLCVWIDPIDCTKGFVKGDFEDVTILIGISQNKKAQMGVIGVPYKRVDGQLIYNPKVVFGSVTQKLAYQYCLQKQSCSPLFKKETTGIPSIATSNSRITKLDDVFIEQLKATRIQAGGSGRKTDMVIRGGISLACYAFEKTSKWDSCAGDAVIRAMGGYFTDCYGQQILYNPESPKQSNANGYLCTFDKQLLQKSIAICKSYKQPML